MIIKNINKYNSVDKFIDACQKDIGIKQLIDSKIIPEITKEILLEKGVKPSLDGFFYKNQIFDLRTKLGKDTTKDYGQTYNVEVPELERTNIVKFLEHLVPEAPEIKRFLLATLSNQFQEEIKNIRKKYDIQESGFSNAEECKKWVKEKKKLAKKELKNITLADHIIKNRETGHIFGEKDNYSDNIFTSLGKLKKDCNDLFNKYKLPAPLVAETYIIWDLNNLRLVGYLNSYNFSDPFVTPNKWTLNDEKKTINWGIPKGKFGIFISRPVTKKSLKKYIDQHWERVKKEMEIFYEEVPLNKNFKTDWLIFAYHKLGISNREICGKLKFTYKINDIKIDKIKQTISRLKIRIEQIEAVTRK
ncbi:hypothetical protein EXS45_02110 [Candidatus Nomurabacteria bacterium]|nr:hypothetical protein [Candidatus Nomurabacteria bacterium]